MSPSKKNKLTTNTEFQRLVLAAMTRCIKLGLDELTTRDGKVDNEAEYKLLLWMREKGQKGSLQDHFSNQIIANSTFVVAILEMYDDTTNDDIETTEEGDKLIVDLDDAKPKVMDKITANHYLYMLAGAIPEDFAKTEFKDGTWQVPSVTE